MRPKICLVLSGGGARGAAHIGVLRVLEEYRVPVDCIAGTSMGALVGAAYATGLTSPEMDRIVAGMTTGFLIKEKPPRQELSMRRKQDDYLSFFGPEFGVGEGGLKLPKGLVSGVQIETVLRRLSKVQGFYRFDDLPIPFRAVATDLVTGKAVIFKEGVLANVMRASMAVPGAVAPAEFDGMILADGMLTSNLPVQTAREMGADIVIAVNVGTPLLKREELSSIFGVAGQMLSILTEQNVQASLASMKQDDILISPELEGFSTGDFDRLAEISPLGEAAARMVSERLKALSIPQEEYAALRVRQTQVMASDTRPIDDIRFSDFKHINPQVARQSLITEVGKPADQATLDADLRRLYGTGDYERVAYRFIDDSDKRVLMVDAIEKSWGPDYVRFGLGLSSDLNSESNYNLLASYRKTWINSFGAEWRTVFKAGTPNGFLSEFYQPLSAEGPFFVAPYVGYESRKTDVYQGDNRIATISYRTSKVGLDLGTQWKEYGEARIGLLKGVRYPKLDTGPTSLAPSASSIAQAAFRASLLLDQLDNTSFPRDGWSVRAEIFKSHRSLGADDNYTKWSADSTIVRSFGSHSFNLSFKAGGHVGQGPLPQYDLFQLGGFLSLSGYTTGQLLGERLAFSRLMYYRQIFDSGLLEGGYAGVSLEAGKVGNPLVRGSPTGLLKSASIFTAIDTPLGAVYLGYGRAAAGDSSFYFYLGKPY
ncbi:esterase [Parazoarcus communis]|uniref:Esterase n=2 Tax=Parazoarcus communis TaxID=41977 RepID=A0A2U8H851_9RHOO|nr:esterase [Parazoarcus communis]